MVIASQLPRDRIPIDSSGPVTEIECFWKKACLYYCLTYRNAIEAAD